MILQGKRALITGGSSGIGFAIAEAILAKGGKVAITRRRPNVLTEAAEQLRQGGRSVDSIAADVSTDEGRETTLKLALERRPRYPRQQCWWSEGRPALAEAVRDHSAL
jgi:uncharacterized oxidoreductase